MTKYISVTNYLLVQIVSFLLVVIVLLFNKQDKLGMWINLFFIYNLLQMTLTLPYIKKLRKEANRKHGNS